jgi:hypothetical protein
MDRVFGSHIGGKDAIMLQQARADVGLDQHVEQLAEKAALGSEHVDIRGLAMRRMLELERRHDGSF